MRSDALFPAVFCEKTTKTNSSSGKLQVRKADPVPASTLNATQRKSGDRVRLPDCNFLMTCNFFLTCNLRELELFLSYQQLPPVF